MQVLSNLEYEDFKKTISSPRLRVYESHCANAHQTVELYFFNIKLSESFLTPIEFCEVTLRNAVAEILILKYGDEWFSHPTLKRALTLNKLKELELVIEKFKTQGVEFGSDDIVASMNLSFWEHFLSKKFYSTIWRGQVSYIFPYMEEKIEEAEFLEKLRLAVNAVRKIRNRIAHHEEIVFKHKLGQRYTECLFVVRSRSMTTLKLLEESQQVVTCLMERKNFKNLSVL